MTPRPEMAEQVSPPYPPHHRDSGPQPLRRPPAEPPAASYRTTLTRLYAPGGAYDLVPAPTDSHSPAAVFGTDDAVHVVSGCNGFGRLSTRAENARTQAALEDHASLSGWVWSHTVTYPASRAWVETGVVVRGVPLETVVGVAKRHGQATVTTWGQRGLTITATGVDPDLDLDPSPVPVTIRPADTGCPMRFGDSAGPCVREGGPWGSRAIHVAGVWQDHRDLLVDTFGCSVCATQPSAEAGRAIALTDKFTPSRHGGWQYGPPMPLGHVLDTP